MKSVAAVAILSAVLALPLVAQHGAAHGGGFSGGHVSAPASGSHPGSATGSRGFGGSAARGGGYSRGSYYNAPGRRFSAGSPSAYHFSPSPRPSAYRPYYSRPNVPNGLHTHDGGRDHHRAIYWHGGVYPYASWYGGYPLFTGYVDPWLFDNCAGPYGWDAWCDESGYSAYNGGDVPAPYPQYGTDPGWGPGAAPDQGPYSPEQPAAPQWQPQGQPQPVHPGYSPSASVAGMRPDTVTVIFNDGRPPEQIQNYLLTAHTLTVFDSKYREIPLAAVNLAATVETNRAAGVEFRVPGGD